MLFFVSLLVDGALAGGVPRNGVRRGGAALGSYLVLIAMLFARPYGMFGRPSVERV